MYYVSKTLEISAAHKLDLDYESKCKNLHGHNWKIIVHCKSEELDQNGMVVDFTHMKEIVMSLDHTNLCKEFPECNTTAENIAIFICEEISKCYKVEIWESEGNYACYERDE